MAGYSEQQVWVAELVGTTVFTFIGLGGIANAVLPGTKGHGIGFLGIAFCFGLGVFLPLQFIGHISGFFNPAVSLGAAVVSDITWTRFVVCVSAQMVGAFLGAIFTWFTYIPHFQPLELVEKPDDGALCDCCDLEANGVAIIKQELSKPAHRYASAGSRDQHKHNSLTRVQPEEAEHPVASLWHNLKRKLVQTTQCSDPKTGSMSDHGDSFNKLHQARAKSMKAACGPSVLQRIAEDQEVKLIVFCTRPSVQKRYWIYCFWAEFSLTFLLTYGAFSISGRSIAITPGVPKSPEAGLYKEGLEPLLIGLLVFALVLCGGGTTGPALNPARDLSPRIVHFFVPIPGKGSSEWWYSWVPVVAPCLGAVLGALFARSMTNMLKSGLV